jgi:hypothetical protein
MSKWYVVGKIGGFIGSLKTIVLLGVGFVGGCLLMDDRKSKHSGYPIKRYGEDPVYDAGWRSGYHCGVTSRNERDKDNDDE